MLLKNFKKLDLESKMEYLDQYLLPIKQDNDKEVFCGDCRFSSKIYPLLCKKNEKILDGLISSPIEKFVYLYDQISIDEYKLLYKRISCECMNSECRCSYFVKRWFNFF